MSVEAQVRGAKNPQEALIAVAKGIDQILEMLTAQLAPAQAGWGAWQPAEAIGDGQFDPVYAVEGDEDETTVTIPPASEEKRAKRRELAGAMALEEHATFAGIEDIEEIYAKGGPVWLYTCDRDFVMSLPDYMRREMVADVLEDDPVTAHDMARDVLKDTDNAGIAKALAEQRDEQING